MNNHLDFSWHMYECVHEWPSGGVGVGVGGVTVTPLTAASEFTTTNVSVTSALVHDELRRPQPGSATASHGVTLHPGGGRGCPERAKRATPQP